MLLGLMIMDFSGFGSRNIFESTAAICSGVAALISIKTGKLPAVLGVFGLALFGAFYPSIYRLYGFWGVLLSLNATTLPLALFPISCWCLGYFSLPLGMMFVAPLGITLCSYKLTHRNLIAVLASLFLALIAATAFELSTAQHRFRVCEESTFSPGYKIGAALQKIFPDSFGGESAIRSNLHGTDISPAASGIVIAEHDTPPEKRAGKIKQGNFTQPAPWSKNEFLGNQYWRYAIREDGCLVSNLGGQLTPSGQIMLAIPSPNLFSPTILASKDGETIYCSDSDYWVNRLCNYQQNLLGVILSDKQRSWPPLIANIAFALIALGSLFRPWIALSFVLVPLLLISGSTGRDGDIRLVGSIYNPHDPARAWAVARRLQDEGINVVFGGNRAKVLLVEEGYSAKIAGEKMVIAEPRATILIGSHKIQVLEEPQGAVDSIPDARRPPGSH
jgi:hypothetical protein